MGERIRGFDWRAHPLGEPDGWPPSLQLAVRMCLDAIVPVTVYWTDACFVLYNDAWAALHPDKHPQILGKSARESWADIWQLVGPQFDHVLRTGEGVFVDSQMLPMVRNGKPTETWWNYSMTALRDEDQRVAGIFTQGNDITAVVQGRRARRAELARWRDLLQHAPAAVALLRGARHEFEFINDAYSRLIGGRDVIGIPLHDALPEVASQGFVAVLDGVYRTGEPYFGSSMPVKLLHRAGQPAEDRVLDFIFQAVHDGAGSVEGIFIMATDVTERARAEGALRITNWQLGEERARLAAMIEAEQRAQSALRRFNDTLEAHVKSRTAELTRALAAQNAVADRLRATFATELIFQGFIDTAGTLLDSNPASLAAIHARLPDVVGRPFWETRWFIDTPGMVDRVREAVIEALSGRTVNSDMVLNLPGGQRRFQFWLRPVFNARQEIIGLVPEALETTEPQQQGLKLAV